MYIIVVVVVIIIIVIVSFIKNHSINIRRCNVLFLISLSFPIPPSFYPILPFFFFVILPCPPLSSHSFLSPRSWPHLLIQLRGLWSTVSSLSGFGRSLAAKRVLVHFEIKMEYSLSLYYLHVKKSQVKIMLIA